jgi:hypothetical protein
MTFTPHIYSTIAKVTIHRLPSPTLPSLAEISGKMSLVAVTRLVSSTSILQLRCREN